MCIKSFPKVTLSIIGICAYFVKAVSIFLEESFVKHSQASRHRMRGFDAGFSILTARAIKNGQCRGYTLVELLAVLAIMAVLAGFLTGSIPGAKTSQDITKNAYDIAGILDQARTKAMANNTYTWVGFYEEDPSGTAGTGQLVISVVSSVDGTNLNPTGTAHPVFDANSLSKLYQVNKLIKIPNVHLASALTTSSLSLTGVPRPTYPTTSTTPPSSQVANSSTFTAGTTIPFPLTSTSGQYNFSQIIQFNPQGDASPIYDSPTQIMEIGLQPTHGNQVSSGPNVVAIQIVGIGGRVTIYRP